MSETSPDSTLDSIAAARWDVIIVGAGPAGSAAACSSAARGLRTLIVDKAVFPRHKVCGGCVSPSGLRALDALGVGPAVRQRGVPIDRFALHARGWRCAVPLDGRGIAIGREVLDEILLTRAQEVGAVQAQECSAGLMHSGPEGVEVMLSRKGERAVARAAIVVASDGLAGSFLPKGQGWEPRIARRSRFGVGARIAPEDAGELDSLLVAGQITMLCGNDGYLGLMKLADGSIDAAAALDPETTKRRGGPGPALASIVAESGRLARAEPLCAQWRGTPLLTRSRRVEAPGVFVAGDAAGYVEPFTGEGISWALRAGDALGEHVEAAAAHRYRAGSWSGALRGLTSGRRASCRLLTLAIRSPRLVSGAAALMEIAPQFAALARRSFAGPWNSGKGLARHA